MIVLSPAASRWRSSTANACLRSRPSCRSRARPVLAARRPAPMGWSPPGRALPALPAPAEALFFAPRSAVAAITLAGPGPRRRPRRRPPLGRCLELPGDNAATIPSKTPEMLVASAATQDPARISAMTQQPRPARNRGLLAGHPTSQSGPGGHPRRIAATSIWRSGVPFRLRQTPRPCPDPRRARARR